MERHSSAHLRHASAQRWQCSILCFEHSSAHRWHTSAQAAQMTFELSLARLIAAAASAQISAQSMSSAMQRAIILTSCS